MLLGDIPPMGRELCFYGFPIARAGTCAVHPQHKWPNPRLRQLFAFNAYAPSPPGDYRQAPFAVYSAAVGSVTVPGSAIAAKAARCRYAAGSSPRSWAVSISE